MKTKLSFALGALMMLGSAQAQTSVESFYKGKTIDFYIGFSPGGGYDSYARLLAQIGRAHV